MNTFFNTTPSKRIIEFNKLKFYLKKCSWLATRENKDYYQDLIKRVDNDIEFNRILVKEYKERKELEKLQGRVVPGQQKLF